MKKQIELKKYPGNYLHYLHFILEIKSEVLGLYPNVCRMVMNILSIKHVHIFNWQRTKSQLKHLICLHTSAVIGHKACLTPLPFLMDEHD